MEEVVKDGIKRDVDDPLGPVYLNGQPITNVDYPKYYKEYLYVKEKYKDKITLKLGLEFGIQVHTINQYVIIKSTSRKIELVKLHIIK